MSSLSVAECHKSLHHGLIPAVPLTLGASGEIDAAAQERYVAHMASQPVAGVAVWAHTGRGLLLSREQRSHVLRAWRDGLGPGKTLIAGVGGSPQHAGDPRAFVDSALRMAADALENGAHALSDRFERRLPFRLDAAKSCDRERDCATRTRNYPETHSSQAARR